MPTAASTSPSANQPNPSSPPTASGATSIDLQRWRPSATDHWDRRKAAHLLRRAGFGYKPEELDTIVKLGMDRTVDLLLSASRHGLQERGYMVLPQGELLNLNTDTRGQRAQWIHEAAHTNSPLREKIALFWHDHFSVGIAASTTREGPLQIAHSNIFRRLGLGKFKDILIEVTRDPAMLIYLDNYINGRPRNGRPSINENYGRELLELYTMGEGNGYSQQDVIEASKCLSGWSLTGRNKFIFRTNYHVTGDKVVLGQRIAWAGEPEVSALLDVILKHPATARYTGGKLFAYFVAENPPATLLDEVAALWRSVDYDVSALLSVLLRSNFFYSDRAIGQLVKSPMDLIVGAIKHLGTPAIDRYRNITPWLDSMGLPLMRYPNPSGVEEGAEWLGSIATIARVNFAAELTRLSTTANFRVLHDPWREIHRMGIDNVEHLVDHYLDVLVGTNTTPPLVREFLIEFMNRTDTGVRRFRFTNTIVREKVTGLIHLVMSLPEYQLL